MKKGVSSSSGLDRKTVETNRRLQMKVLTFKLSSLCPTHHLNSNKVLSQHESFEHAAAYINHLLERIEELKGRREQAMRINGINNNIRDRGMIGSSSPVLELRDLGSRLEVILISGLNKNFKLYDIIGVLEEEGTEVVNVSLSVVGDKVFHTIYSQVASPRVGVETSRVYRRLMELIN